jgi:mono/diheme cytochrome c family protein
MTGDVKARVVLLGTLAIIADGCGGGGNDELAVQTRAADPTAGKRVFVNAGCGSCHTFEAAGSMRDVGPNLDLVVKKYDASFIRESIINPGAFTEKVGDEPGSIGGEGDRPYHAAMPVFGPKADFSNQQLTDQQLDDLLAFLTQRH